MSVTFSVPGARPTTTVCPWCDEARAEGAKLNELGGYCSPWCGGTEVDREEPYVNFANVNAASILDLLGLNGDDGTGYLGGEVEPSELRSRIIKAMNTDRSSAHREAYELEPGHAGTRIVADPDTGLKRIERRGCRVISAGSDDEQVMRRLEQLDGLAIWAQENEHDTIAWS